MLRDGLTTSVRTWLVVHKTVYSLQYINYLDLGELCGLQRQSITSPNSKSMHAVAATMLPAVSPGARSSPNSSTPINLFSSMPQTQEQRSLSPNA